MKLYFCHSRDFDYERELYAPIRTSDLNATHDIVFPHEKSGVAQTKDVIRSSDIVFAEVSHPATGLGIEIGWANALSVPIVCVYKKGSKISDSLRFITNDFIEYADGDDLVTKITNFLSKQV